METENIIIVCVIVFCFIILFLCWYFQSRITKTSKFLGQILDIIQESSQNLTRNYNLNNIDAVEKLINEKWKVYDSLLSFHHILYSFKKLRLKSYLTPEQIEILKKNQI